MQTLTISKVDAKAIKVLEDLEALNLMRAFRKETTSPNKNAQNNIPIYFLHQLANL